MVTIRKFLQGIGLIPVSSTAIDTKGELEVLSTGGKLNYHNGTTASPVVTESHTATLTNKSMDGGSNTFTNLPTSSFSGQVTVPNGGTGVATLTAHGVVIGEGTSAVAVTSAGTSGQALVSGGASADPAFGTLPVSGGGTGDTTLTNHGVLLGQGTSAVAITAVGATGTVLRGNTGADPTFGAVVLTTDVSGVLPIANGGTNVNSVTVSPTATSFAGWDANKNLSANNFLRGYTTTATAAGTTTLTVSSTFLQYFTGSTTQTVTLPVTSTLVLGQEYLIENRSTGTVTVQSSGANTIKAMEANSQLLVAVILTTGTTAASWDFAYSIVQGSLPVADGGTGAATITNHGVVLGQGTSAVVATSVGATGTVLRGQTGADPVFGAVVLTTDVTGVLPAANVGLVRTINAQTGTTYTFVLGDGSAAGGNPLVTASNASAQTYTVPPNSSVAYPTGTQIDVLQLGAGKVTLAQGSGVTINSKSSNKAISAQYVGVSLIKTATDTWELIGDLIA